MTRFDKPPEVKEEKKLRPEMEIKKPFIRPQLQAIKEETSGSRVESQETSGSVHEKIMENVQQHKKDEESRTSVDFKSVCSGGDDKMHIIDEDVPRVANPSDVESSGDTVPRNMFWKRYKKSSNEKLGDADKEVKKVESENTTTDYYADLADKEPGDIKETVDAPTDTNTSVEKMLNSYSISLKKCENKQNLTTSSSAAVLVMQKSQPVVPSKQIIGDGPVKLPSNLKLKSALKPSWKSKQSLSCCELVEYCDVQFGGKSVMNLQPKG